MKLLIGIISIYKNTHQTKMIISIRAKAAASFGKVYCSIWLIEFSNLARVCNFNIADSGTRDHYII